MVEAIQHDLEFCDNIGIDPNTAHLLHLQLRGVRVIGDSNSACGSDCSAYGEIHLRFPNDLLGGITAVPRKLPVVPDYESPYSFLENTILYHEEEIFERGTVVPVPLPEPGSPRYLKGYSFPFVGTKNPFYELRINPKNTGHCPGRCAFCHRGFSHRCTPPPGSRVLTPSEIVSSIVNFHGSSALRQVAHVSVITELFGSEDRFLSYLEELKSALLENGCREDFSFRACSQDVRSENGLSRLRSIVDGDRFSFTLEVFERRDEIMSPYKGLNIAQVEHILLTARQAGFREIKLNYVTGIDPLQAFEQGVRRFRDLGVFDLIGLSILTAFFPDQRRLRHPDAWRLSYYVAVIRMLKSAGISLYEPTCFEMGYPVQFLDNGLPWMRDGEAVHRTEVIRDCEIC